MPVIDFDYKVKWKDFPVRSQGAGTMTEAAQIHPEISFSNFKLTRTKTAVSLKDADVKLFLVTADCWVIDKQQSNDLLQHEQGHFDILAISARDLYQAMLAITAKSTQELQVELKNLQLKFGAKATQTNASYDELTKNGSDADVQSKWDLILEKTKKNVRGSMNDLPA